MSYILRRCQPVWMKEVLPLLSETEDGGILFLSVDGCQVTVPCAHLIIASPLMRNILADPVILPPIYSPLAISIPSVSGDVLKLVREVLVAGEAFADSDTIREVRQVFELLQVEDGMVCSKLENISLDNAFTDEVNEEGDDDDDVRGMQGNNDYEIVVKLEEENVNMKNISVDGNYDICENRIYKSDLSSNEAKRYRKTTSNVSLKMSGSIKQKRLDCNICCKKFKTSATLNKHTRDVHQKNGYKCQICDVAFKLQWNLYSHTVTVHKKTQFPCKFCGKMFTIISSMLRHVKTCLEEFSCQFCEKNFARGDALNYHIQNEH